MNSRSFTLSDHAIFRIRLTVVEGSRNQFLNRSGRTIYLADGQYTDETSIRQNAFSIILPKSEYVVGAALLEWVSVYVTPTQFYGATEDVLTLVTWLAGEYGTIVPTSTEFVQLDIEDRIETGEVIANTVQNYSPVWTIGQWNTLMVRIHIPPLDPLSRPAIILFEGSDDNVNWISVQRIRPAITSYATLNPFYAYFRLGLYTYMPTGFSMRYRVRMTRRIFPPIAYSEPWGIIRENHQVSTGSLVQVALGRRTLMSTTGRLVRGYIDTPLTTPYDPTESGLYIPFSCGTNTPFEISIPAEVVVVNVVDARPSPTTLTIQHITNT